ncbi:MAG: hypothetical protein ABI910_18980 [Gemmatimonadota bacterium]
MIGGDVLTSYQQPLRGYSAQRLARRSLVGVACSLLAVATGAQEGGNGREHQLVTASQPEGRLLAFYSAAMVFTPIGTLPRGERWSVGLEGTWIPILNESQRRPGIDKPETTNLAPILPRPRLAVRTRFADLDASWVPPLPVADASANLYAVAASRTLRRWRGTEVTPRLSIVGGRVRGAITCNARTAAQDGATLATYYAAVCRGHESDDWFEPRILAAELVAIRPLPGRARRGHVWIALGERIDRSRFDIGVQRTDGSRDPDHPVLQLRDVRPHASVGARWRLSNRTLAAAEGFYAPGSLATIRLFAAVAGRRP